MHAGIKEVVVVEDASDVLWAIEVDGVELTRVKPGESVVVGRKPIRPMVEAEADRRVDVADPEKSMSKRHAMLTVDAYGRAILEDLGSTNGTFVVRDDGGLMRIPLGTQITFQRSPMHLQFGDKAVDFREVSSDDTGEHQVSSLFENMTPDQIANAANGAMSVDQILDVRAGEPTTAFDANAVRGRVHELNTSHLVQSYVTTSPVDEEPAVQTAPADDQAAPAQNDAASGQAAQFAQPVQSLQPEQSAQSAPQMAPQTMPQVQMNQDGAPVHVELSSQELVQASAQSPAAVTPQASISAAVTPQAQESEPVVSGQEQTQPDAQAQQVQPEVQDAQPQSVETPVADTNAPQQAALVQNAEVLADSGNVQPNDAAQAQSQQTAEVKPLIPMSGEPGAQPGNRVESAATQQATPQSADQSVNQPATQSASQPAPASQSAESEPQQEASYPVASYPVRGAYAQATNYSSAYETSDSSTWPATGQHQGFDSEAANLSAANQAVANQTAANQAVSNQPVANQPAASDSMISADSAADARFRPQAADDARFAVHQQPQQETLAAQNGANGSAYARASFSQPVTNPHYDAGGVLDRLQNGQFPGQTPGQIPGQAQQTNDDQIIDGFTIRQARTSADYQQQFKMAQHPQLLPFLAMNPSLYGDLYAWLAAQGNADVESALANNAGYQAWKQGK